MDKTAIAHWAPEIGGQFWWNGIFFILIFVPFMQKNIPFHQN